MKESQLSAEVELLQSSDRPQRVSRSPISMNFEVCLVLQPCSLHFISRKIQECNGNKLSGSVDVIELLLFYRFRLRLLVFVFVS